MKQPDRRRIGGAKGADADQTEEPRLKNLPAADRSQRRAGRKDIRKSPFVGTTSAQLKSPGSPIKRRSKKRPRARLWSTTTIGGKTEIPTPADPISIERRRSAGGSTKSLARVAVGLDENIQKGLILLSQLLQLLLQLLDAATANFASEPQQSDFVLKHRDAVVDFRFFDRFIHSLSLWFLRCQHSDILSFRN
jgi:hypothetical protein